MLVFREGIDLGVSKNRDTPKMDGENNGKPYFLMDDLGKTHYFGKHPFKVYSNGEVNP